MRTLGEIIEAGKSGNLVTHEECYWSMLSLEALGVFDMMSLMRRYEEASKGIMSKLRIELDWRERCRRVQTAYETDPKEWMGPNHDPSNPEVQSCRRVSLKIADQAMKGELPNQRKEDDG